MQMSGEDPLKLRLNGAPVGRALVGRKVSWRRELAHHKEPQIPRSD
jgi:hypothetical protein